MNPNELIEISELIKREFEDLYDKLVALQKSAENGKNNLNNRGICDNLDINYNQRDILRNAFRAWDEFSGNILWPVTIEENPSDEYVAALGKRYMWDANHPYGAARLRLLEHCIYYVKERIIQNAMHKKFFERESNL